MTTADLTLFLDFDGVLHPLWEPVPYNEWTLEQIFAPKAYAGPFFVHAPILIELLSGHLLRMVISSAWGANATWQRSRDFCPQSWQHEKNAAYHHLLTPEAVGPGQEPSSRWTEIARYREHVHPGIGDRWPAIDDDISGWPPEAVRPKLHRGDLTT